MYIGGMKFTCRRHHRTPKPKVRVLLDVDGVLTVSGRMPHPAWKNWRSERSFRFSPDVAAFVRSLASNPDVEVMFLTTYGAEANKRVGVPMHLPWILSAGEPPFAVRGTVATAEDAEDKGWWKLQAAQRLSADGIPFVWVDDTLCNSTEAVEWLRSLAPTSFLAINPDWTSGLVAEELGWIAEFVVDQMA